MNNRREIAKDFANKINSEDISSIILFGSVARGDDTSDSDIDILIVSSNKEKIEDLIYTEVSNFIVNNNEHISPHIISEEKFNDVNKLPVLKNIAIEGEILG